MHVGVTQDSHEIHVTWKPQNLANAYIHGSVSTHFNVAKYIILYQYNLFILK